MIPLSTRSTSLMTGSCSISTSRMMPKRSPVRKCWVRVPWTMLHHESPDQKGLGTFFVVGGTGLEQHGHAAGGATNTPVGCLLVRGSQRLGMSTKKDAARPFGLGMWWAVQNSNSNKQRQGITVAVCPAFCFASSYIVRFGSIAAYVRTWSVRTYAGKRASSDI